MADNYLERRMEDFRNGKLSVKGGIPGIRPNGQRVLMVGALTEDALDKLLEFRRKGCRVALFDSDEEAGRRMAYLHGIRYHHVDTTLNNDISEETISLLKVWRGIDVIVADENKSNVIKQSIEEWKKSLPIPDLSEAKIVIIPRTENNN